MRIRSIDPNPAESNGEPPTCNNALKPSSRVGSHRTTVAPKTGSLAPSVGEGLTMKIEITDESTKLHASEHIIATAARRADRQWEVSGWTRPLTRNQAITALVLAERLAAGYGDDDPFVAGWREELARD
jgi:hypothetical protein